MRVIVNPERAMLSIAMLAAFADGAKDDRERESVKQFAQQMGSTTIDTMGIYQDVLLKRVTLEQVTSALVDEGQRHYAYELAVCVCDSDGLRCDDENKFLKELKTLLGLDADPVASEAEHQADAIALGGAMVVGVVAGSSLTDIDSNQLTTNQSAAAEITSVNVSCPKSALPKSTLDDAALDKMVLNYSIMNGALELLPQSWASVAIIPMQVKMVYRIGKSYGHELDQGHIREFIATVGVGMTSQYLEQFGRKLIGGLLGSFLGKTGKKVGGAAAGVAMSFATTYALGQVAKRYYGGGRQMSTDLLKQSFSGLLAPAQKMQTQYLPEIQEKARNLDAKSVLAMVRGGGI
jgi:uncharacterized protein (DUF697 family)/tellurite resistance protein